MKQFTDRRLEAWRQHHDRFACSCEDKALRKRIAKSGAVHYVYQCQRCGKVSLQAVARAKAFDLCGGQEPAPLDTTLRDEWKRVKDEAAKKVDREIGEVFWSGYDEYLASAAWAARRNLVLKRAAGVCQGCGNARPTDVHHLTYEHVGAEFLFELVAVCHECHERLHLERQRASP